MRHKPETPEQLATLTEAWEVACEYKPTVEHFRLLAEFLWENQESVEVDIDLTFRTLYCHNRFFRNFENQPSYLLDNVQENYLGDRHSKMLKDPLYRRKKFCEEL